MAHWGDRLCTILKIRGFQKSYAIAHALGVNESTVSRWKKGEPISMQHGVALCRFLGVSMDWLFLGENLETTSFPSNEVLLTMELARLLQKHPPAVTSAMIRLVEVISSPPDD